MFTKENCNILVVAEPEHIRVRGNAIDSGDPKFDSKVERKIERDLRNGNQWAWCSVAVTVSPKDPEHCELEATDYLGACSYKSKKDFVMNSGYYDDMVETCLDELNQMVQPQAEELFDTDAKVNLVAPPVDSFNLYRERFFLPALEFALKGRALNTVKDTAEIMNGVWLSLSAISNEAGEVIPELFTVLRTDIDDASRKLSDLRNELDDDIGQDHDA